MRTSDIISLHVRLSEETKGLIGKAELEKMQPHCILINTARAGLVDEAALIEALQSRQIYGAGLDVFEQEPLAPDHPFLSMDCVTLTPHVGGMFPAVAQLSIHIQVNALKSFLENWRRERKGGAE